MPSPFAICPTQLKICSNKVKRGVEEKQRASVLLKKCFPKGLCGQHDMSPGKVLYVYDVCERKTLLDFGDSMV